MFYLFQPNGGKQVRIFLTIILMGQTIISPAAKGRELKRDDITCKITYCAVGEEDISFFINIFFMIMNLTLRFKKTTFLNVLLHNNRFLINKII